MLIYTPPSTAKSIPVIDLSDSFSDNLEKRKSVAWEIHKACRTTGFFYIKNHGIASEVLQKQLDIAKQFFDLPIENKLEIDFKNSKCLRGYEPMAAQTLDEGSPPDLKEGFMSGKNLDSSHPYVQKGYPQALLQITTNGKLKTVLAKGAAYESFPWSAFSGRNHSLGCALVL